MTKLKLLDLPVRALTEIGVSTLFPSARIWAWASQLSQRALQLRVELAVDGLMDELPRPESTSASFPDPLYKRRATCSGIQTDVSPYHWPGAVTWCLIGGAIRQ